MACFRFYAELNDFLAPARRGHDFEHPVAPHESAKHAVESLGVPHTEIGLLLVNGTPSPLDVRLQPLDRVAVLPALRRLALQPPPAAPRFTADAHLGRLARLLRFAGYDTRWHAAGSDAELARQASLEARIVLTRDRALLMHREVQAGCWLRDTEPLAQLADVGRRYALALDAGRPSRCLACNAQPLPCPKARVLAQLPERTRGCFDAFWRCPGCARIYWRGSHWRRLHATVENAWRPC